MDLFKDNGYEEMRAGKTVFSEQFNLDKSNFSKYSNMERPIPLESLVLISNKFNISLDELIKGGDSKGQSVSAGRDMSGVNQAGRDISTGGGDCEQKLAAALKEITHLNKEIGHLNERLQDKEDMIALLKGRKD
ncbi:hypothetical protein C8N40_11160 [Pontibacter mucosus]|uniref:Uncharacterized protein n=2 Tax=Pontibacter mucosus TaxID=1649266 RepID=A0A2T5YD17_9BACT|nr:hypothetical protein C8N40_11160 [Pontibacter mucosus]